MSTKVRIKFSRYLLVDGSTVGGGPDRFNDAVNDLLAGGWVLEGGVAASGKSLFQAMSKPVEEERVV